MEINQGEVISTRTVEIGPGTLITNNIGSQQGDDEMEEEEGIAIGTSTPDPKPPASPPTRSLQVNRWLVGGGPLHRPCFLPIPWEEESPCRRVGFFAGVTSVIVAL
jgi:hypothetical protein